MSTAMGVMIKIFIIKVLKRETIPLSCGMKHANNVCMYIIMVELSEDEKVSIQKTEVIDFESLLITFNCSEEYFLWR